MTRLKAQNKELRIRPPVEEWKAAQHGYRPEPGDEAPGTAPIEIAHSELPEFEP
jgi:hypothetical protein